ncbi:helix-turn-helix transcriptional regulator [Rhodococcus sp. IEGM 1330]|uniref:helix-turn-helix domain-containing protein n=1 Tax=Rhodococcus sp. IEGM 1330 TaxID=3082225 RepID=UPI002954D7D2|nr:helix-turn-helix transcriptional regulator [Rhodococcus sp. IEGM 1330]MDV8024033.1 helix-turn-helix transcriptional regulator [Rhodococcus sp. IEGM 1330]
MVRIPLTPGELARGARLGTALRRSRGTRTMTDVADAARISVETLRKIETGRIPTPAFFTVAALCEALNISLDALADSTSNTAPTHSEADAS